MVMTNPLRRLIVAKIKKLQEDIATIERMESEYPEEVADTSDREDKGEEKR